MLRSNVLAAAIIAVGSVTMLSGQAGATAPVSPPSSAPPVAYNFVGLCDDCAGTATAELLLLDYTAPATLTVNNFAGFTYESNLHAFHLAPGVKLNGIAGSFPSSTPGATFPADFVLSGYVDDTVTGQYSYFAFYTEINGNWELLINGNVSDIGTNGEWAVPEPTSLALLGLGLTGLGVIRRRRA